MLVPFISASVYSVSASLRASVRKAGKVKDEGQIVTGVERDGAEIENGRDQHNTVDVNAVMLLQIISQRGGAEGAVTFADEKFRRVPAIAAIEIDVDELREHFYVLIDAPEILVLRLADGVTETGADGVNEDHVGLVQQGIRVVFYFVGSRRSGGVV